MVITMKNSKFLRSALMLVLALVIIGSVTGGTIAWFTDTVEATDNVIQSGNLDMVVEYKTKWEDDWATLEEDTKLFNEEALYEPGYTEVVFLRIANAGNLAFKYDLAIAVEDTVISQSVLGNDIKLSEHMEMGIYTLDEYNDGFNYADLLMPVMFADRDTTLSNVTMTSLKEKAGDNTVTLSTNTPCLPAPSDENSMVVALVLHMPTTVGNEANHRTDKVAPQMSLGLKAVATQYTHEEDAFDNQYDKDANDYPVAGVEKITDTTKYVTFKPLNAPEPKRDETVDIGYVFTALEDAETVQDNRYKDWHADFTISFDKEVKAGIVGLAGEYGTYGWIGIDIDQDVINAAMKREDATSTDPLPANTPVRMLDTAGINFNYEMICDIVKTFNCGTYAITDEANGITATVELRLYEPADDFTNTDNESTTGRYITLGSFPYKYEYKGE